MVLPGEEIEWSDDMGKFGDKFVIEVCKPEKRASTFDKHRGFPFLDGRKFNRIHFNLFLANNHAQEFYVRYVKDAFGKFKGQSMFTKVK